MSRKIKRGGNSMFGRRAGNIGLKILVWVLAIVVLFYGGYYLGALLFGDSNKEIVYNPGNSEPTSSTTSESSSSSQPEKEEEKKQLLLYCESEILLDAQKRDDFFIAAREQGATGIVFPFKDENGQIFFTVSHPVTQKAGSVVENAINLSELYAELEALDLEGVPMMHTFMDPLAAGKNPALAIWYNNGIPNYLWLDNFADKGGKAWLNPYKEDARNYLLDLTELLYQTGFKQIILTGNQFGASKDSETATYGEEFTDSFLECMTEFVTLCEAQARKADAVCWFAEDALELYQGNKMMEASFVDTGASHIIPVFYLSGMKRNVKIGDKTVSSPADDAATVTTLLLEAYAEKNDAAVFMPMFTDYPSITAKQIGVLTKDTPYILTSF